MSPLALGSLTCAVFLGCSTPADDAGGVGAGDASTSNGAHQDGGSIGAGNDATASGMVDGTTVGEGDGAIVQIDAPAVDANAVCPATPNAGGAFLRFNQVGYRKGGIPSTFS